MKLVILDRDVGIPPPRADADVHRYSLNWHVADRERFAEGIVVALQLCGAGVTLEIAVLKRGAGIQTPFFAYQPYAVYARAFFQHRAGIDVLRAAQFLIGRYAQQGFAGGVPVCRNPPCEAVEIGAWLELRNGAAKMTTQAILVLTIHPPGLASQLQLGRHAPVAQQVVFGLPVAVVRHFDNKRERRANEGRTRHSQHLRIGIFGIDPAHLCTQAAALGREIAQRHILRPLLDIL